MQGRGRRKGKREKGEGGALRTHFFLLSSCHVALYTMLSVIVSKIKQNLQILLYSAKMESDYLCVDVGMEKKKGRIEQSHTMGKYLFLRLLVSWWAHGKEM